MYIDINPKPQTAREIQLYAKLNTIQLEYEERRRPYIDELKEIEFKRYKDKFGEIKPIEFGGIK